MNVHAMTFVNQVVKPAFVAAAVIAGILATWLLLVDLVPVLGQFWRPRGTAQAHAIVGACLAHIARS